MSPFAGYDDFDACVRDNSDKDDPEAYCAEIKRQVDGEAALSDAETQALADSDCPEGEAMVNGECVPVTEVENVPPTSLSLPSPVHLERFDPERIERVQEDDTTVRYTSIKLIGPGHWTDSESRETVWYSPEGIKNLEVDPDNAVHILHDSDNEVSRAGHIDAESVRHADNGVFADLVFDTSTSAGQFADENLQAALESGGAKGFGGPSVEIPPEGQKVEFNHEQGVPELKGGRISALGLVNRPGSKDVHFARQTAQAAVALATSEQSVMARETEHASMSDVTVDGDTLLDAADIELDDDRELADVPVTELVSLIAESYDVDPADLMDALDPFMDGEEAEMQEDDDEDEEDEPDEEPDEEDENDADVDIDMEDAMENLETRISALEDQLDSLMAAEDVEEELEAATEELADADTVAELSEAVEALEDAKEELAERTRELEDQPKAPKTLADGANAEENGDSVTGPITEIEPSGRY